MGKCKDVLATEVSGRQWVYAQLVKNGRDFDRIQKHMEARALAEHHATPSRRERDEDEITDRQAAVRARDQAALIVVRADIADALMYSGTHRPIEQTATESNSS